MAAENVKLKTQQCQSLLVPVYNMNDTSGVCMLKPIVWQIWCFERALNCSVWSAFPVILCEQQMLQLWVDSPDSKGYLKNCCICIYKQP